MRNIAVGLMLIMIASWTAQADGKAITNDDVVGMVKGHLPESTIVLAIQNGECEFDTSPPALLSLNGAGVTQNILNAMLSAGTKRTEAGPALANVQPSPPAESVLASILQQTAQQQSGGVASVAGLRKLNGQSGNKDGIPIYIMQFEATVRFNQNCIWKGIQFDPALTFQVALPAQTAKAGAGWDNFLYQSQNPGVQAPGGSLWSVKGEATFVLSEQGWATQSIVHGDIARTTDVVRSAEPMPSPGSPAAQGMGPTNAELAKLLLTPQTRRAEDVMCTSFETARAICPAGFSIQVVSTGISEQALFQAQSGSGFIFSINSKFAGLFGPRTAATALDAEAQAFRNQFNVVGVAGPIPSRIGKYDALSILFTFRTATGVFQELVTEALVGRRLLLVTMSGSIPEVSKSWGMYSAICDSFLYDKSKQSF